MILVQFLINRVLILILIFITTELLDITGISTLSVCFVIILFIVLFSVINVFLWIFEQITLIIDRGLFYILC